MRRGSKEEHIDESAPIDEGFIKEKKKTDPSLSKVINQISSHQKFQ